MGEFSWENFFKLSIFRDEYGDAVVTGFLFALWLGFDECRGMSL